MWKNIRVKRSAIPSNIKTFREYIEGKITFEQTKIGFMRRNEIVELSDEDFAKWLAGLGWRKKGKEDETEGICTGIYGSDREDR